MRAKGIGDDDTPWIAYTDFFTSLTIVFFLLSLLAFQDARAGILVGNVKDGRTDRPIAGCPVAVRNLDEGGTPRTYRTEEDGSFRSNFPGLRRPATMEVSVSCPNFPEVLYDTAVVAAGKVASVSFLFTTRGAITVTTVEGDALFETGQYVLRPEARALLDSIGRRLVAQLGDGEVLAIQGHTDDVPFPIESDRDNWMLSAERAAAAARFLIQEVGFSECQIVIMGFGPSRPRQGHQLADGDPPSVIAEKRRLNRRIEFRILSGGSIYGEQEHGFCCDSDCRFSGVQ